MIAGIRKVVDFVEKVNAAIGDQQIKVIDIRGGLPVNFDCDEFKPIFRVRQSPGALGVPGGLKQPVGRRNSLVVAGGDHACVLHAKVHSIRQHFAHEMTAILLCRNST